MMTDFHRCNKHGEFQDSFVHCPKCFDKEHECEAIKCKQRVGANGVFCIYHDKMILEEALKLQVLSSNFPSNFFLTTRYPKAFTRQLMRCKLLIAEIEGIPVDVMPTYRYTVF